MAQAYIGIGSNLGDRQAHLDQARQALTQLPQSRLAAFSKAYETEPVGGPDGQNKFLNAAALVETHLRPRHLMNELLKIEQAAGRQRGEPNAPRTLDLDLLLYNDRVIDEGGLTVPHPRMAQRRFVLEPLAEIAPLAMHPIHRRTIAALLEDV